MAAFSSTNVPIGAGLLYVAPVGTTEPTTASAALPSAWRPVGYTEDGNEFTYELTNEAIEVAEEFDPIKYATTGRNASVTFNMAEATRQNLALALNAGANAATSGSLEPPSPGTEVRVMIALDAGGIPSAPNATQTGSRWILRQCLQADTVTIPRKKAPDNSIIPVTFRLEKPASLQPFIVFPDVNGNI